MKIDRRWVIFTYRGKLYEHVKQHPCIHPKSGGNFFPRLKTSEIIGKEYGVTGRTVKNDEQFSQAVGKMPTGQKQRNLTSQEASYYRGKLYESRKRQGARTDLTSAQNVLKFNTADFPQFLREVN